MEKIKSSIIFIFVVLCIVFCMLRCDGDVYDKIYDLTNGRIEYVLPKNDSIPVYIYDTVNKTITITNGNGYVPRTDTVFSDVIVYDEGKVDTASIIRRYDSLICVYKDAVVYRDSIIRLLKTKRVYIDTLKDDDVIVVLSDTVFDNMLIQPRTSMILNTRKSSDIFIKENKFMYGLGVGYSKSDLYGDLHISYDIKQKYMLRGDLLFGKDAIIMFSFSKKF